MIQALDVFLLNRARQDLTGTPTLVDRNPGHDGRMVIVSRNHLLPLLGEAFHVLFAEIVGVRHLSPSNETHLVAPVEPAWIFHLLMLASAIQAEGFGHLDIVLNRLVGGWR